MGVKLCPTGIIRLTISERLDAKLLNENERARGTKNILDLWPNTVLLFFWFGLSLIVNILWGRPIMLVHRIINSSRAALSLIFLAKIIDIAERFLGK